MSPRNAVPRPARKQPDTGAGGFSAEERAAMQARARERKAEARASASRAEGERDIQTAIAAMSEPDRAMAARLHELVAAAAPTLAPRTWYGMPAWARDGKVVCFFQGAQKFKTRYATFGFSDAARLDDGDSWPVAFAVRKLTPAVAARITALIQRSVR